MEIKKIFKYNALCFIYILLQLIVAIFSFMDDEIIGNEINISYAIFIHVSTLCFFILGYLPKSQKYLINYKLINKKRILLSNNFVIISILFIFIGLVTSISTIGEIMSPTEYLNKIFSGNSNQELTEAKILAGEGGLSGILKMLNYLPLGVYLILSGIKIFYSYSEKDKSRLNLVIYTSLIACFIKMFFSLDRLTLLAILLVFVYSFFLDKKINSKAIILISVVFLLLGFITSLRMDESSILDFIIVYFKLSITNFQLVLDSQTDWSYGFNTFLMPLVFIFKFFGIENFDVTGPEKWVWNYAQYFTSSFFIDFGYFFFIGFYMLGVFVRKVQVKSIYGKKYYTQIYFIILFALASFVSVPIVRGVEFWVMLLLAYIYNKLYKTT